MENKKTDRIMALDILRIISMMGIICLHVLNNGGIMNNLREGTSTYKAICIIAAIAYTSVNIFGILSGYIYSGKETIKYKRFIELWTTVILYSIIITVITLLKHKEYLPNTISVIRSVFPSIEGRYWYITCYSLVFLLIPYINKLISALDNKSLGRMIFVIFLCLSLFSTFGFYDYFRIGNGYSSAWLIFCYLLGAYRRRKKNGIGTCWILVAFLTCIIIAGFSRTIYNNANDDLRHYFRTQDWLFQYNSPLIVVGSIGIFDLIIKWKLKTNVIMQTVSTATFGVYILHSHPIVYDYYIKDAFVDIASMPAFYSLVHLAKTIIMIFLSCSIIDCIRMALFSGWKKMIKR